MKRTKDDLARNEDLNKVFRVNFDLYTPRPHFIIVPRNVKQFEKIQDYNHLSIDQKEELVQVANTKISEYKLEKGTTILSIHRGSWKSKKEKNKYRYFHAHICAEVDEYIRVFKEKEHELIQGDIPKDYEKMVRDSLFDTYYTDDLADLGETKANKTEKVTTYGENYTLLYHPSKPRVGFAVKKTEDTTVKDYIQALEAMNKYAEQEDVANMKSKRNEFDRGCHVCLIFPEHRSQHGFELLTLLGYIEVNAVKFYRDLCPASKRDVWKTKFGGLGHYKVPT